MSDLTFRERGRGLHLDDPRLDPLDRRYGVRAGAGALQVSKNRDRFLPETKDQRRSNACVGFSGALALEALEFAVTGKVPPKYSPMFGWYNARAAIGQQGVNSGCTIRDYAECAKRYGVCSEDREPFNLEKLDDYLVRLSHRPSAASYEEAERHQILESYALPDGDLEAAGDALVRGYGFQTAFPVYDSFFDTPATGIVPKWLGNLSGWHAVYAIDIDRVDGVWGLWMVNSWGKDFGKGGQFFISQEMYARFQDSRVYSKVEVLDA